MTTLARNFVVRQWPWLGFIVSLMLFVPSPALDLWASSQFYRAGEGFFLGNTAIPMLVYHGTGEVIGGLGLAMIALLALSCFKAARLRWPFLQTQRGVLAFLVLALILGPGIITHSIFKNHWGRPRPIQIAEFGGAGHYVPPFVPSKQCRTNCSFYSGHAAAGFYLMAFSFVARNRRRWLFAGIALGSAVGLVRIIQGAHFLSDVVFCGYAIWAWSWLLHRGMLRMGWLPPPINTARR